MIPVSRSDEDIAKALKWVVETFHRHHLPFQVVGGLAAHAYGGRRPIVDLDFYAPLAGADGFLATVAEHTVWGPEHHKDESWDLRFMKIDYGPVRIEIGDTSSEPKFFDQLNQQWILQDISFSKSTTWRAPVMAGSAAPASAGGKAGETWT